MDYTTIIIGIMAVLHAVQIAFHVRANKRLKAVEDATDTTNKVDPVGTALNAIKACADFNGRLTKAEKRVFDLEAKGHHHK